MRNRRGAMLMLTAIALAAGPAMAATDACVQNNRIVSTSVIDGSTVVVTDTDKKQYTVHMRGNCVGLDRNAVNLSFRTKTRLGCLSRGDTISYSMPGEGTKPRVRPNLQTPCVVDGVTEGAPEQKHN
jgi:hypothetical protein